MAVNVVVQDGIVKSLALRYDAESKPELRFTLVQTESATDGKSWQVYLPCCAAGQAALRLAETLEDGQHILITSGKLCYRKREGKMGLQSRMEILVWTVDRLTKLPQDERTDTGEGDSTSAGEIVPPDGDRERLPSKKGKPRDPKHLKQPWTPAEAN